jgi:hypothetical protein
MSTEPVPRQPRLIRASIYLGIVCVLIILMLGIKGAELIYGREAMFPWFCLDFAIGSPLMLMALNGANNCLRRRKNVFSAFLAAALIYAAGCGAGINQAHDAPNWMAWTVWISSAIGFVLMFQAISDSR